jgi:histidine triad (HIT) family protein
LTDCLFCSIAAGDIPADTMSESDRVMAFRDISPQAPTHVLVIPKAHYPDIGALVATDAALVGELVRTAADVASAEGIEGGWRLLFNTGPDAGQTVFHVHAHILGGRRLGALG